MIEVVLNNSFGGFSLNEEMATWLVRNKGWVVLNDKEYDYREKYSIETLLHMFGSYVAPYPNNNSFEFRSNKDLIECVRFFKKLHENKFKERVNSLKIEKLDTQFSIEDYHDGYEKVVVDVNYGEEE